MAPTTIHATASELASTTTKADLERWLTEELPKGSEPFVRPLVVNPENGTRFTTFIFKAQKRKQGRRILGDLREHGNELRDSGGSRYRPVLSWDCIGLSMLAWSSPDARFDVCFVHGFGGHALKTFTSKSHNHHHAVLWPQDLLPELLESHGVRGRYMTFGYEQGLWEEDRTTLSLSDEAELLIDSLVRVRGRHCPKPLFFVCHSLGGLVVCEAVRLAYHQKYPVTERDAFYANGQFTIQGVITFGTPFRGSRLANILATVAKSLLLHKTWALNTTTLTYLSVDNADIKTMVEDFRDVRSTLNLPMILFYEGLKLRPIRNVVVTRTSATTIFGDDVPKKLIRANHRNMVKFDRNDPNFRSVGPDIKSLVRSSLVQFEQNRRAGIRQLPTDHVKASRHAWATQPQSHAADASNLNTRSSAEPDSELKAAPSELNTGFRSHMSSLGGIHDFMERLRQRHVVLDRSNDDSTGGTCDWIWRKLKVQNWFRSEKNSVLFVEGRAGLGKSTLCRYMIRTLPEQYAQQALTEGEPAIGDAGHTPALPPLVAYFLMENRDHIRGTKDILHTLVAQLADHDRSAINDLAASLFERSKGAENLDFWVSLVAKSPGRLKRDVVCVIDGLDECILHLTEHERKVAPEDTERFLRRICAVADTEPSEKQCRLRVILFSRPRQEIDAAIGERNIRMAIDDADIRQSFEIMVRHKVTMMAEGLRNGRTFPQENQNLVIDGVIEKCSPIFQMAHQLLQQLDRNCSLDKQTELQHTITEFKSEGFNEIYKAYLAKIQVHQRDVAARLLKTLYFVNGKFTIEQLQFALAAQSGSETDTLEPQSIDFFLRSDYGALVRVRENKEIHLDHPSVRDFLSNLSARDYVEFSCVNKKDGHALLASACVKYLLHFVHAQPRLDDANLKEYSEHLASDPFLKYAALQWTAHVRECGDLVFNHRAVSDLFLLKNYAVMFTLRYLAANPDEDPCEVPRIIPPGHFLAENDLSYLLFALCHDHSKFWTKLRFTARAVFWWKRSDSTVKVDDTDDVGRTPLHYACESGSRDAAVILLACKAKGILRDDWGKTPFDLAVSNGHGKVAAMLIANHQAFDGRPSLKPQANNLHMACFHNLESVVKYLLDKGADPNARARGGWTPFHVVAESGNVNIQRMLLSSQKPTNISAATDRGNTALHLAVRKGNLEFVKRLFEHDPELNPCPTEADGFTPSHIAAQNGEKEMWELLLERQSDVQPDIVGRYPSHMAAMYGHVEILKSLSGSTTLTAENKSGRQPLHLAAYNGQLDCVKWLLENTGVDFEAGCFDLSDTEDGRTTRALTPCFLAALGGSEEVVGFLLEKGARVDVKQSDGQTMVHAASELGSVRLMKMLADRGLDLWAKTKNQSALLHYAAYHGNLELVKMQVEGADNIKPPPDFDINVREKNGDTALCLALFRRSTLVADYLIDKGADTTIGDNDGITPLIHAINASMTNLVKKLLENGANPNASGPDLWSPLHAAARYGFLDALELLLSTDIAINRVFQGFQASPLVVAAAHHQENVVRRLLQVPDIDVTLRDVFGKTAFDYLRDSPNFEDICQSWETQDSPQTEEVRRATLIKLLKQTLEKMDFEDLQTRKNEHILLRAFLWLGDEESARILIEQAVIRLDSGRPYHSSIFCDVCCEDVREWPVRHCMVCYDFDVCDSCYQSEESQQEPICVRQHPLLEFGGQTWKALAAGTVNREGDTLASWFAKQKEKYQNMPDPRPEEPESGQAAPRLHPPPSQDGDHPSAGSSATLTLPRNQAVELNLPELGSVLAPSPLDALATLDSRQKPLLTPFEFRRSRSYASSIRRASEMVSSAEAMEEEVPRKPGDAGV